MLKDFLKSMVELRKSIAELREAQKKTDEQMRLTDERLENLKMETEKFKMETFEQMRLTDQRIEKRIGKLTDTQGLLWGSLSREGIIKSLEGEGYEIICYSKLKAKIEIKKHYQFH